MKQQTSYKNFFLNYAIFVLITACVFSILIYIIRIAQKSWEKNLKASVEYALAETEPDTWEIGKYIRINNPLSSSAACYDARNKKSGQNCRVVIIRIQSFYGPQAGIYIIEPEGNVIFKGYSSLHGRCNVQLTNSISGRRVEYWSMRLAEMFK